MMTRTKIVVGLMFTLGLLSCSTQKAVTTESVEDNSKTFKVQLVELPCLTAMNHEQEESFEEPVPKPYAKSAVYVAQRDKKGAFVNQKMYKLDAEGAIDLDLDTVTHFFSPDPLIIEREQGDTTPLAGKELCELEWTRMHATVVAVSADQFEYDVLLMKECSFCDEPGQE